MSSRLRYVILFTAFSTAASLPAIPPSAGEIVARARAQLGEESALEDLVTLQIIGRILPAAPDMPDAKVHLTARRPLSQRLEVKIDDIVETTIINGARSCMMRCNASVDDSHHMRPLSAKEAARLRFSTVNLFSFYRPDTRSGETLDYGGIVLHRGMRCHRLIYSCPDGSTSTRYFTVSNNRLISSLNCRGIETVESGEQSVGGIRFPRKIDSFQDGRLLHTFLLEQILVNKPLRAGVFTVPAHSAVSQPVAVGK